MNDNLEEIFGKLIAFASQEDARVYGTGFWKIGHRLAKEKYEPAKHFFVSRLDDSRRDWRRVSVELLGFHYQLETQVVDKIRSMLATDPDSGVRIAAAYTLGKQSRFPESALMHALKIDSNHLVREAAFSSLLELAGVSYKTKAKELGSINAGEITPDLDQLKRILSNENLHALINLLVV
jgi:hypothetical protein